MLYKDFVFAGLENLGGEHGEGYILDAMQEDEQGIQTRRWEPTGHVGSTWD